MTVLSAMFYIGEDEAKDDQKKKKVQIFAPTGGFFKDVKKG